MPSKKLQIVDNGIGVSLNVRYDPLTKSVKPEVVAKNKDGKEVKQRTVYKDEVLLPGSTQRKWVDDDGNTYQENELSFWYENETVEPISQTKVMDITGYQPVKNYTDMYVIEKYYEIYPDDNGMKKDWDRKRAVANNLTQMRKLWEHLKEKQVVARGEFCTASRGFVASDGYIRAIDLEGKWGLEVGQFKQEKIFQHLQEGVPSEMPEVKEVKSRKKLKMV